MSEAADICGEPRQSDGEPCEQPAGWGRTTSEGPCRHHASGGDGDGQSGRCGRQRTDARDRPYGEPQIRRILEALEDGATRKGAARAAGVGPRTLRRWVNRYDDLEERIVRAEAEAETGAVGVIREAADAGDWRAAAWLAEKRFGYDSEGLDEEEVAEFVEAVREAIVGVLDEERAAEVMEAIDEVLEERFGG